MNVSFGAVHKQAWGGEYVNCLCHNISFVINLSTTGGGVKNPQNPAYYVVYGRPLRGCTRCGLRAKNNVDTSTQKLSRTRRLLSNFSLKSEVVSLVSICPDLGRYTGRDNNDD